MIEQLSDFGKKRRSEKTRNQWIHDALKEEPISIEIVISEDGRFQMFELIEKRLTVAEAITAKKGKARLLLDKAEEVLCYGGESSKKKHVLFLEKLRDYADLPELTPVIAFYGQNRADGADKALKYFETAISEKNRQGNIGFRIQAEGYRIHEKPGVLKKVIAKYEAAQEKAVADNQKACAICGQSRYPVVDVPHGMIKRVPNGQTSGCALVSYNEKAFESYGLQGNENSSICTNCAKTYVEGLNWLLSAGNETVTKTKKGKEKPQFRYTHRRNFGTDTAMVFWTRDNKELQEIDQIEAPDPGQVARLIESVASATTADSQYIEPDYFYSFTLSGSAARITVRDWIETSLHEFKTSIVHWFKDIAIMAYDSDSKQPKTRYARLYDLARTCQRRNSDGSYDKDDVALARTATHLWNAALKNSALPLWMLTRTLQRARLDANGVTPERAALIKVILNRNIKGGSFMITEGIEDGRKPVAYVCGQIFAKIETIQYYALGDRNAGIRERYFTYALTSPAAAFGRLFNLNSKHFTKLKTEKPGLAVTLDKELQELCKDIDISRFPANFTLEEQGQFAIGYYHQRQRQFNAGNEN